MGCELAVFIQLISVVIPSSACIVAAIDGSIAAVVVEMICVMEFVEEEEEEVRGGVTVISVEVDLVGSLVSFGGMEFREESGAVD